MTAREFTRERTRIINNTNAEIRALLQEAATRIAAILAAQPTDYQRWYLPQLMAEIERVLRDYGVQAGRTAAAGQAGSVTAGSGIVDAALRASQVSAIVPRVASSQLQAMTSFLTEKIRGITVATANDINTQLGLVTMGVQGPNEAIRSVQALLGEAVTARAEMIVRTELARGFSTASFERLREASGYVPGIRKEWRKSGKIHPRLAHVAINGQVREWNAPFVLHAGRVTMMYPHDPAAPAAETINCGCVMLPVVPAG